jgi:transposase
MGIRRNRHKKEAGKMKSMEITAVGIDVSKRKSTVAIRRPGGVIVACPFDISHSSHDLEKLVSILKTTGGDIRVVMEHTSNYWKPIALTLKNAGFYVSVVNAMLIHDFSDNSIRKLKTDRADSLKIANYALTFWNQLPPFNDEDETRLVLKEQSRINSLFSSSVSNVGLDDSIACLTEGEITNVLPHKELNKICS